MQPSYEGSESSHAQYDPQRDLTSLLPEAAVTHVFLRKATVYRQLRDLKRVGFDIFVNLCEGYLDWDIPSIDVIHALDRLNLPYTGPSASLYDPAKSLMKIVAWYAGVAVPASVLARTAADAQIAASRLRFPMFVKPDHGGDSLGIDEDSICHDAHQLERRTRRIIAEFDAAIIDEYIDGREFSVLVLGSPRARGSPVALRPVEFVFPDGERFKTYLLKASQYLPQCNVPLADSPLDRALRTAACSIFSSFAGVGYCRIDFRLGHDAIPRVIDVNFACSVFYSSGAHGTADYILAHDGLGQAGFLRHIIDEGIARHARAQKCYEVTPQAVEGYGIRSTRSIRYGEIVFRGEERAQRLATRRHVEKNWHAADIDLYRRYAYPVCDHVRLLWDERPESWAPQNHSCAPNTAYFGLDVIALCDIEEGCELTLDYATFCDQHMQPFSCRCGSPACRGLIAGPLGNSVDHRERQVGEG